MPWCARKNEPVEMVISVRSFDGSEICRSMKDFISERGSDLEVTTGSCVPPGITRMSKSEMSSWASV